MTRNFPEGFVWGVAAASYQIEGGATEGGRGPSIWDTFSHTPGKVVGGDTGDVACDHYRRWESDLDLMAELGFQNYRLSIAWPRVMADGKTLNKEGLDFYDRLVDGMLARGINPLATLYHWDLPQALDQGGSYGWLDRTVADHFAEFARVVGELLGDRLSAVTTLNEPWCSAYLGYGSGEHAPGLTDNSLCYPVAHHLNLAHGKAVQALRSVLPATTGVSVTLNIHQLEAASDSAEDLAATQHLDLVANRIWLDPMLKGGYPAELLETTSHLTDWSFIKDGDEADIHQPIDFLGVNYYNPQRIAAPTPGQGTFPGTDKAASIGYGPEVETTIMGWPIVPSGLTDLLVRLHNDYGVPLQVTENGISSEELLDPQAVADAAADDSTVAVHDTQRVNYLRDHLGALLDAIDKGVDVNGYYAWSVMDNFEWAWGYAKRFGIIHVDFPTQSRHPKDSAFFYSDVIKANALAV
ncbi:MAG: GH1 family beta-glucosidase [Nocardioides sp.]